MFLSVIRHGNRSSRGTVELSVLLAFKTGICLVILEIILKKKKCRGRFKPRVLLVQQNLDPSHNVHIVV